MKQDDQGEFHHKDDPVAVALLMVLGIGFLIGVAVTWVIFMI